MTAETDEEGWLRLCPLNPCSTRASTTQLGSDYTLILFTAVRVPSLPI